MKEYPAFGGKPIGATGTIFIEVEGVDALHDRLKPNVKIVMPIVTQFYGMREFAIEDPDGYVITFAERVQRKDTKGQRTQRQQNASVSSVYLCVLQRRRASASSFCFSASSLWPASPSFPSAVSRW